MPTGIVVEYNPMHIGHLYHIEQAKQIEESEPIVAVMSGYFVQRGEPAIIDPIIRARIAITQGVDLVILLPVMHSIQSAQYFAQGSVDLLLACGMDRIVYGSERNDAWIDAFDAAQTEESETVLQRALHSGTSYADAHAKSISGEYLDANTRLGLAYRKAIRYRKAKVPAIAVSRKPWTYSDVPKEKQNASYLRGEIRSGVITDLPLASPITGPYHEIDRYRTELLYLLTIAPISPLDYPYAEPGLWERLQKTMDPHQSVDEWVERASSKRHTQSRIRRYLLHMLLGITTIERDAFLYREPDAIVPLAMNEKGQQILRSCKERISVLSTEKAFHRHIHRTDSIYRYDVRAKKLYDLGLLGVTTT